MKRTAEKFIENYQKNDTVKRVLVTGAAGQIGTDLYPYLFHLYGDENVLLTDIVPSIEGVSKRCYKKLDVKNREQFDTLVKAHKPDTVIHLAAILSAKSEVKPEVAGKINRKGGMNAIELATEHGYKLFLPSSIGAFGPNTPKQQTPDVTYQRPRNLYGISKYFLELYGEYHYHKYNTDFRSLRYPSVISRKYSKHSIGYGLADIYRNAITEKKYTQYLKPGQKISSLYTDDLIEGTIRFIEAPSENLQYRTYNMQSCSFTIQEQADSIREQIPEFQVEYEINNMQDIMELLPEELDNSGAERDWGYKPQFSLSDITSDILYDIKEEIAEAERSSSSDSDSESSSEDEKSNSKSH